MYFFPLSLRELSQQDVQVWLTQKIPRVSFHVHIYRIILKCLLHKQFQKKGFFFCNGRTYCIPSFVPRNHFLIIITFLIFSSKTIKGTINLELVKEVVQPSKCTGILFLLLQFSFKNNQGSPSDVAWLIGFLWFFSSETVIKL